MYPRFSVALVVFAGALLVLTNAHRETILPLEYRRPQPHDTLFPVVSTASSTLSKGPLDQSLTKTKDDSTPQIKNTQSQATAVPPPEIKKATNNAGRTESLYTFPPFAPEELNVFTRGALVHILCKGAPPLKSISGSGVVIDERGIVLTNAHIAQYLLLAERTEAPLECVIRRGPDLALTYSTMLYMPLAWVEKHGKNILADTQTGTGESDFALFYLSPTGTTTYPFVKPDPREQAIGGTALIAAYPAEFLRNASPESFNATSALVTVGEFFTFSTSTLDAFSLGPNPLAQGGSSGGPVVNQWGRLIGLITTTSDGKTTGDRNLHAISVPHINRALKDAGGLETFIARDIPSILAKQHEQLDALAKQLIGYAGIER